MGSASEPGSEASLTAVNPHALPCPVCRQQQALLSEGGEPVAEPAGDHSIILFASSFAPFRQPWKLQRLRPSPLLSRVRRGGPNHPRSSAWRGGGTCCCSACLACPFRRRARLVQDRLLCVVAAITDDIGRGSATARGRRAGDASARVTAQARASHWRLR